MKTIVNGRNIELTAGIKQAVDEKLKRLEHFDFVQEIHLILGVEKNPRIAANQVAEATIHIPGSVLHVQAESENLYASLDLLVDKIDRSLNKHKTKLMNRTHDHAHSIRHPEADGLLDEDDEDNEPEPMLSPEDLDAQVTIASGKDA